MTATQHSICVFCGSSPGRQPEYVAAAEQLGQQMAKATGWRLVYGGGSRGCMGAVAASYCRADGDILGVIPEAMTKKAPRGHPTTSAEGKGPDVIDFSKLGKGNFETVVTQDMHDRKKRMADESDLGFVALPGGYGTFEEVFEMVTWTQLGIHRKPIVLINVAGFYEPLRALVQKAVSDEFIASAGANVISFVDEEDAKRHGGWGDAAVVEVKRANEQLAASEVKGYFDWNKSSGTATDAVQNGDGGKYKVPTALRDTAEKDLSIDVRDLTFAFASQQEPALQECNLKLSRGSRCLLIGANGAGKSTILRLLAGKRMPTRGAHMRVFGRDVFHEAPGGITYLGTEWAMNPVVRSDIEVATFLDSVGGYRHKARRDELLDILDVDTAWRMHAISDGERRRVQLTMGLMEPWDVLLLDEVTVDLDVQVRADLLAFLARETETRGATIIYATHIFDGLQDFPTHLVHMRHGKTTTKTPISWPPRASPPSGDEGEFDALPRVWKEHKQGVTPPNLFETALAWLREDREVRADEEARSQDTAARKRGAKRNAAGTETDSERFFSKYDYNQIQTR